MHTRTHHPSALLLNQHLEKTLIWEHDLRNKPLIYPRQVLGTSFHGVTSQRLVVAGLVVEKNDRGQGEMQRPPHTHILYGRGERVFSEDSAPSYGSCVCVGKCLLVLLSRKRQSLLGTFCCSRGLNQI